MKNIENNIISINQSKKFKHPCKSLSTITSSKAETDLEKFNMLDEIIDKSIEEGEQDFLTGMLIW